ncbi:hypothetical protein ACQ4PT_023243 [Festuca glaucescens]
MKRGGCEVEAGGINHHITVSSRPHPHKIWSRPDDLLLDAAPAVPGDAPPSSMSSSSRCRLVLRNVACRARPGELLATSAPAPPASPRSSRSSPAASTPPTAATSASTAPLSTPPPCAASAATSPSATSSSRSSPSVRRSTSVPGAVDALVSDLALSRVADARVKDLSGGERRRVSIGVEAVHDPAVLILDEPTSGLDSASALQIVAALRSMADSPRGRTVVLSIHQPGARIVKMFDAVLLLAAGSVLHHGSVDALGSLLADAGLRLPPHVDTVEFAIDSVDDLRIHLHRHQRRDRCTLQQLFHQHKLIQAADDDKRLDSSHGHGEGYANSWPREVAVLSQRFFRNVARTRQLFACRTVCMLIAGLALGSIFYDLGDDKAAERVGLFAFLLTFLLSSTTEALPVFLQEREILAKETSSGAYRVSAYAVANAAVFLPFQLVLAAVFATPAYWLTGLRRTAPAFGYFMLLIWLVLYTANSVGGVLRGGGPGLRGGERGHPRRDGFLFLFSGYFITKSAMPAYWVPMHYLSLFKWPFEAMLLNEFGGRCVARAMGVCVATGDEVLRREGIGEECRWRNVGVMVGFVVFYRVLGYAVLRVRCALTLKGAAERSALSSSPCCFSSTPKP